MCKQLPEASGRSPDVTHYAILRRNPDTDASQVFHVIESNAGPETSYSDGTVSASSTYIYRAKSVSPTGVSQWSGYVKAETPAAPDSTLEPTPTPTPTPSPEPVSTPAPEDLRPTGLTVSLVDNKVTLSWTAPAEDAGSVDGYEILRRRPTEGESALATLVADTESTATTYTDATANEAGVRYVYRVKALRGDDVSLWSNFDRIDLPSDYVPDPTPTPEPESTSDDQAPTGLSATLADGGGVALSWTAPSEDADSVTGYEVLRAVGGGEFTTLAADTASTTTSYTDTTATEAGETYAYQVKAIRGEDRSQASGQAQVQLPHDPVDLAPTGLTALTLFVSLEGNISYSVHLSWTAPAEDVDSITGYEILRAVGEGALATLVDDTGNTATSYNDATATQTGETYTYTVKAIRGEDRSQASGQARVQIPHDPVDLAPSDLTAEAVDGGGVDLSWSAPAEDAGNVTGYEVLRAVGEGDMATLAADTASTTTTYTDATATGEGETYAYKVKAIRGQARSHASNRVSLVPVEPPAPPENLKPTNLTFEIREDGVTLAWDAPAADADSVTGYRVVRRRPNQGENEWLVWKWDTGSTETTYKDGYAQTHGEYYVYRVRALRGDDYSKMSNRVDVRRPETTPQTAEWAPSNLQAQMYFEVALGEEGVTTQVKLTWDAPAEGVEWVRGYEVQRATCDGDFTSLVSDTGSTETGYADAEFEEGETYTYRVRARRPQGLSLWSGTQTLLVPGGNGESECAAPTFLLSQVQDPQTGLTPATLLNTLLGYDEAEGAGTLAPNELIFGEDGTFRVTSVNAWPGVSGLVLYLTAGSSEQDAAFADRDFILEAKEAVLVVGATEFSFDDAVLSHSDTTGDNAEYTGVVIATWTEGQAGLVAGETVDFRLLLRSRPDEAQFTQHDTDIVLVKNTGQTADGGKFSLTLSNRKAAQAFTIGARQFVTLGSVGISFHTVVEPQTFDRELTVTLNANNGGFPGEALCTLSHPATFTSSGVHAFDAGTCPSLWGGVTYFAVFDRTTVHEGEASFARTTSTSEDTGGAAGWLIANESLKSVQGVWEKEASKPYLIEVKGTYGTTQAPAVVVKNTGQTADGSAVSLKAKGEDGTQNPTGPHRLAQEFVTGTNPGGYRLHSIKFDFHEIEIAVTDLDTNVRKPDGELKVTLHAEQKALLDAHRGIPGDVICTLSHSELFNTSGVHTFDAETCPRLEPDTNYFAVMTRVSGAIYRVSLKVTTSADEDSGGAPDWVIRDSRFLAPAARFDSLRRWRTTDSESYMIEISASVVDPDEQSSASEAVILPLVAAGNQHPAGLWSDGATMWVADYDDSKIYAYDMATRALVPDEDFDTLASGNHAPKGIWSDGTTMWVAQSWTSQTRPTRVYAYDMATKDRVTAKEFPIPAELSVGGFGGFAGNVRDARFEDIWSDGSGTIWLMSEANHAAYSYDITTGEPIPSERLFAGRLYLPGPSGIWGDDQSIWLSDFGNRILRAFWRYDKSPQPARDIQLDPDNANPVGLWGDGTTLWVTDFRDSKIYAYPVPDQEPPQRFTRRLSVERVTDTTAIVAMDLRDMPFNGQRQHVSISVNTTSYAIYAHPDAKTARFMLRGLEPETQYTVNGNFGLQPRTRLDDVVFRTDYARLDDIEVSDLTHTEATVTVSLAGADVNKRAYPNLWVSSDRTEPERTYFLRHRASDETDWSEPVELTFSGPTTDVRLTGLDPGTAYDVVLAEDEEFTTQTASSEGYTGTLTVGEDFGFLGYEQAYSYGSLAPDPTFEVGGAEHSITELYVDPVGFGQRMLNLGFDRTLPIDYDVTPPLGTVFTLTVGMETFSSADATYTTGSSAYSWPYSLSWSENDEVLVQITIGEPVHYREGTTLEVEGAFSTPPMPPTLAFEAEMTVGSGSTFDGYDASSPTIGSISSDTFEVGGVEYTVSQLTYRTSGTSRYVVVVEPVPPFEFTLTLGTVELPSGTAATLDTSGGGGRQYTWNRSVNPSWSNNDKVDVKLDIGLIDICDRSSAVADAIKAATPSFDFCHMTSPIDLVGITELDLPNGIGTGLKAGDFEGLSGLTRLDLSHYILSLQQLPVGVFDGLDSLTHLDLSHTDLLNLNLGVFDGLDNLEVLDLTDTLLSDRNVPAGIFDDVPNLRSLRITNETRHYENAFGNIGDDFFQGLADLRELDLGASNPLRDSPRSLLPLTALVTYNGQAYTRPADPPANFDYASGRIDHELGFSKTCYAVTLKWDAPTGVNGITGYRILRNLGAESLSRYAKQIATTGASARTFVDGRNADVCFGGVGSGPNVSYFVSAITAGGDSFPARVRVDQTRAFPTTQVPNTPTLRGSLYDLSVAKSPNGYKVRLQWNDLHHNITGYEISFRGSSSAAWRTIVVNAGNVLEYDLESVPVPPSSVPRTAENMFLYNAFRDQGESIGFTDGREFRIRALNAAGNSGWSNVVRPFR